MELMSLEAGPAKALVDLRAGGRLRSLRIFDFELLVQPEDLENPDPLAWGCYVMAPWAGRVRDARFHWAGQDFLIPAREPPHALHGLVLDRPWHLLDLARDRLRASCELPKLDWPFGGEIESAIQLGEDRLIWDLELRAGDEAMPAWMGWHPWFRRCLAVGSPAVLELEARSMHERGADGLPTGRLRGMRPGPWDDAFCDLIRPPRITWKSALQLDLRSDVEDWVIFTEREIGLCVEPQSAPPNAFELGRAAHLPSGGRLKRRFEMHWTRSEDPGERKDTEVSGR